MQDVVGSIFSKLAETLNVTGVTVDNDKALDIAKTLGLVVTPRGKRPVGVTAQRIEPTDVGFLFVGVDPAEIAKAKELDKLQAELAKLEAQNAALKAKRDALVG